VPAPANHTTPQGSTGPTIAISLGDPLGIGAEIVCKALAPEGVRNAARFRVHGARWAMEAAARAAGIAPFWRCAGTASDGGWTGAILLDDGANDERAFAGLTPSPTKRGGELSFRWVEDAIRDAMRPPGDPMRADAIVTAPISKTSWNLAGRAEFPGHTELLAARFGAKRSGMMFVGPHLRVMLATIHVPLMDVGRLLTTERVLEAIELAHQVRGTRPRIAVCGLNPHAGEGGILGTEDDRVIAPAVSQARAKGIDAHGPLPADTVFKAAAAPPMGRGEYDCVVAMYHDQGLIPVKLIDGERAVNVTVGLPTIRTSPAHGTAFDIAGKNTASAASMRAAIELAIRMIAPRT
jgi:4-hydroxythreonine-4-phosphate dehydrogenase